MGSHDVMICQLDSVKSATINHALRCEGPAELRRRVRLRRIQRTLLIKLYLIATLLNTLPPSTSIEIDKKAFENIQQV
jgi:hypothetical protein